MKVYMFDCEWFEYYRVVLEEFVKIIDLIIGGDIFDLGVVVGLEVMEDIFKVWFNFESYVEYNIIGESVIVYFKIIGDIMECFVLVKFENVYVYDFKNNFVGVFENRGRYRVEDFEGDWISFLEFLKVWV